MKCINYMLIPLVKCICISYMDHCGQKKHAESEAHLDLWKWQPFGGWKLVAQATREVVNESAGWLAIVYEAMCHVRTTCISSSDEIYIEHPRGCMGARQSPRDQKDNSKFYPKNWQLSTPLVFHLFGGICISVPKRDLSVCESRYGGEANHLKKE